MGVFHPPDHDLVQLAPAPWQAAQSISVGKTRVCQAFCQILTVKQAWHFAARAPRLSQQVDDKIYGVSG
jgi:hypothetical protein